MTAYAPYRPHRLPNARGRFVDTIIVGPDSVRVERIDVDGRTETLWAWQALTALDDYVRDEVIAEARMKWRCAEVVHERP